MPPLDASLALGSVLAAPARSPGGLEPSSDAGGAPERPAWSDLQVATKQSVQVGTGGDFFELFQHPDGRLSVVMADVCGHGPAAARVAARVRPLVRRSLARGDSPAAVLTTLNDALMSQCVHDRFLTAVAVRVDAPPGRAEVACAGHMGPFLRRAAGAAEAPALPAGVPLGLLADERYVDTMLELGPADTLVLVTDGITDPLSSACDPLGEAALLRRLEGAPRATAGICDALLDDASLFHDDATVVALQLPALASVAAPSAGLTPSSVAA
jgi:serine phosphatase RsbU (regulator of sigma subunit)